MIDYEKSCEQIKMTLGLVRASSRGYRPQLLCYANGHLQVSVLSRPYRSDSERKQSFDEMFGTISAFESDEMLFATDTWVNPTATKIPKIDALQIDGFARKTMTLMSYVYPYIPSNRNELYWVELSGIAPGSMINSGERYSSIAKAFQTPLQMSPAQYVNLLRTRGHDVVGY